MSSLRCLHAKPVPICDVFLWCQLYRGCYREYKIFSLHQYRHRIPTFFNQGSRIIYVPVGDVFITQLLALNLRDQSHLVVVTDCLINDSWYVLSASMDGILCLGKPPKPYLPEDSDKRTAIQDKNRQELGAYPISKKTLPKLGLLS